MRYTAAALLLCLACLAAAEAVIVYQGCWANEVNLTRAMPFRAAANNFMTPDFCRRLAINRNVTSFGLEWGRECWLDPTDGDLATITRFGASNNCSMPCTGDVTTRCGGDFTVDMYTITDLLPATIPEHNVTFLGCFRDDQLDRRMTLLWQSNSSMSIDQCAHIAFSEEWSLFATEWGSECWGSKDVNYTTSLGPSTDCNMPCPANSNQTCGGALALDVYEVVDKYWDVPGYENPWEAPTPMPPAPSSNVNQLAAADCTGAAASSPTCRAQQLQRLQSGASAAVLSTFAVAVCVLAAAVIF